MKKVKTMNKFNVALDKCSCRGFWECVQKLGQQPDPDNSVHDGLPHPQPRVPGHHHLWSGYGHRHARQGSQGEVRELDESKESWSKSWDYYHITLFHYIVLIVLSQEEVDAYKKQYEKESFPGLEVSMEDVTSMMTAPNPGAAVGAKAISEVGNIFLDSALNPKFHILF